MNLCLDKIREEFPDFNLREHTADDFWKKASRDKIKVTEEPLLIPGYYSIKKNKPCIIINSNQSPIEWTLTAFHELIHHLLDADYQKNSILLYRDVQKMQTIQEERAEALALILMVPLKKLEELENTPFDQLHPYTQKLLITRQRVFEKHQI